MTYALLIDVGGTFIKFAHYDFMKAELSGVKRIPTCASTVNRFGGSVIAPSVLRDQIEQVVRSESREGETCTGIFVTGQMHGVLLVDELFEPRSEIYTWRSSVVAPSGSISVSELRRIIGQTREAETGGELREGSPIATLYGLSQHRQLIAGHKALSLISFVAISLASQSRRLLVHQTDAAAYGCFNLKSSNWHWEMLDQLGLGPLNFPEVTGSIESVGVNEVLDCPVFVALGDHQTSLLGSEIQADEVSVNLATGGQVSRVVNNVIGRAQTRPYFAGRFVSCVTQIPAGRSLNTIVKFLADFGKLDEDVVWSRITDELMVVKSSSLIVRNPFFYSADSSLGSISGITEKNLSLGEIFRGALSDIADRVCRAIEIVSPSSHNLKLVMSGGLVSKLSSLQEEIIFRSECKTYRVCSSNDSSLVGLSVLAQQELPR
jgi:sugar (pentulose or hexulose) kinase